MNRLNPRPSEMKSNYTPDSAEEAKQLYTMQERLRFMAQQIDLFQVGNNSALHGPEFEKSLKWLASEWMKLKPAPGSNLK